MQDIKEPILNHWYRALHSEEGVELVCSDPNKVMSRLYKARSDAKDDDLKQVSICISPFDPNKLWLVRRKLPDEKA